MSIIARGNRQPPQPHEISDIYVDESSQTRHRYLVIGGIILRTLDVDAANRKIADLRLPELPHGEMKWGKVSNSKIQAYGRVVKAFFDDPEFSRCDFHSIVVDTSKFDHRRFNEGSREIGFNKEIYQLASKFARLYRDRLFHLYPDERQTNQRPEDLRTILNFGRRKAGDRRDWPFRRCHFRSSRQTPLLQVVDVLTGGVAYAVNSHADAEGASPAKAKLCRYILKRAGIIDVRKETAIAGKFTIWHRQLQGTRSVPRA